VTDAPQITDDTAGQRFVTVVDGVEAKLEYARRGDRLVLQHTEVPDEIGGRGIAGALVRFAVEQARADGATIVPRCPYARRWLEGHPDAAAGVTIEWKRGKESS
jgi:predicted GNAT family acetyltransferase